MSKTADKKERKAATRAEHDRRGYVWRHNAYGGSAVFTQKAMNSIINSPSTTLEAKSLALEIQNRCWELAKALKTRIDP